MRLLRSAEGAWLAAADCYFALADDPRQLGHWPNSKDRRPGPERLHPDHRSIKYYLMIIGKSTMATSYSIGKHFEGLIESLIESGRYSTPSEVIRDVLRRIEDREDGRKARLEAWRAR